MSNRPPTERDKHQSLADRFDQRAIRLRWQANVFLGIIIAVLVGGAAAFVLANDITNLNLGPQTAEAQYVAAVAALKQNQEQQEPLIKQIREINNRSFISMPFNEKIKTAVAELSTLEDDVLKTCENISRSPVARGGGPFAREGGPESGISLSATRLYDNLSVRSSDERIGEYKITTPDKTIFFSNAESATKCSGQFLKVAASITQYLKSIQDISQERDATVVSFLESKTGDTAQVQKKLLPLQDEAPRLSALIKEVQTRVTQERVLGAPLKPGETRDAATGKSDGKTDWARVIETNATRIGALATMFFLVTILVPQYRYNIRMASFYEARSDSIRFLPDTDVRGPDDLGKMVNIMTPNIDFGKAPPTPWDQIIEMIKTAKS
jgi:hypothetical protein